MIAAGVLRKLRKTLQFVLITLLIVVFAHALTWMVGKVSLLDSLEHSVLDFDFSDIYYSGGYRPSPIDTNIILVNIGPLGKGGIARQVEVISHHKPAVIGIDVHFSLVGDSVEVKGLWEVLNNTPGIVLPSQLYQGDHLSGSPDSIILPADAVQFSSRNTGYANINIPPDDPGFGTVRSFLSTVRLADEDHYPFAAVVARYYDTTRFEEYRKRQKSEELINFTGHRILFMEGAINDVTYFTVDFDDILNDNFHPGLFNGKIVLLGYMGNDLYDTSPIDKFYSPMNERFAGRSLPDIYGVEIQANMISMILSGNYVNQSDFLDRLIDMVMLFLAIIIFKYLFDKNEENYSFLSKMVAFIMINIMVIVPLLIYHFFLFKIDLRYGIFYLVFASDLFEVLYPKIRRIRILDVEKQKLTT